jgi:hypothetical protein
VALGDARKAPVIHTVDLTAARHPTAPHVRIHATDNIGVIAVEIELFHPDGTRLHHLPAVLDPRQWWRADLPADLPADCRLVVTARDRPANRTRAEHLLP